MSYAHHLTIPTPARPLDIELAELRAEYEARDRADLSRCVRLYHGWTRWQRERTSSLRDYLRTACPDFETREGSYYRHAHAGAAQAAGFTGTMTLLESLGWALMVAGKTPADVTALVDEHGPEGAARLLRQERSKRSAEATTNRRLPDSAADTLDALTARLQGHPDAPVEDTERRALLVRMLDATPAPVFAALATMAATGENTTDALTDALKAYTVDPYEVMKAGGCMWPGCGTKTGLHAHHVPIGESTKRGNEVVAILCAYHHNQSGNHDHAHGMTRWAVYEAFGGEAQFWQAIALRQADGIQAVKRGSRT